MRFAIESWSPDYGAPTGDVALVDSPTDVDAWVECVEAEWAPRSAPAAAGAVRDLLFVDGVRRVEANVWITDDQNESHQGICASYAAGAVRCNGSAQVVAAEVRRGVFCPVEGAEAIVTRHADFALQVVAEDVPDKLTLALQGRMGELEGQVAASCAGPEDLVLVDGPLKIGQHRTGMVGFVKTHHTSYGPKIVRDVVARLAVAQRTPLLLIGGHSPRFTWYLRLPGEIAHGWAGVVRLEVGTGYEVSEAAHLADQLCLTLPRFASHPQKDPRAPQNLYPIGGLERELRRRLGDPLLIHRSLREAAARARAS